MVLETSKGGGGGGGAEEEGEEEEQEEKEFKAKFKSSKQLDLSFYMRIDIVCVPFKNWIKACPYEIRISAGVIFRYFSIFATFPERLNGQIYEALT